ncbi:MAG: hypothetical protein CVT59_05195 [Actinobacteria bacterium HGW-Actinobacteria-1]|jgi:drug/metabolite transporter (DMT)-like permease|nr:MAG: hypothetical protein CVT59_05195 [Actinobacteria bacterium HGW-Actinobacteria-1]
MTSKINVKREGKGRDIPGPSSSRRVGTAAAIAAAVLALASAAGFAVGIEARRTLSAEALASASAIASAVGILLVSGDVRRIRLRAASEPLFSLVLGALGLFGAPYAVLVHRYSDAPAGSEILFLTTAAWAAILVLFTLGRRRSEVVPIAGALLGLAGIVGVVGNWERPSSFSPFVRFVPEELWMLAAGVAWAALWWHLGRARDRGDLDAAAVPAAVGGVLAAAMMLVARWVTADVPTALAHGGFWLYAVACMAAAAAALLALRSAGPRAIAAAMVLPAVALTALTLVEQATGAFGPQPILLGPASAGSAIALVGALLIWPREPATETLPPTKPCRAAVVVAALSALVAAVGLALPALEGTATGLRTSGAAFEASFTLRGVEVVGPWTVLALAVAVLGIALSRDLRLPSMLALVAAALAWPFVWNTPLRTFTTFIPSEVQVDFGSEFAAIAFKQLPIPVTLVALGGVVVAVALLLVCRSAPRTGTASQTRGDRP